MFTATGVILVLSLAIIAIPTVAPAQSTHPNHPALSRSHPCPPMRIPLSMSLQLNLPTPLLHTPRFFRTNGRHVIAYNISVGGLIVCAYGLHEKQIVNGPSSLFAAHFDIDGLPDIEGRPNLTQSRLMFQKLLLTRFKLAFHNESRSLPAYAIQIAKGGPKLAVTTRKPSDSTNFSYNCQVVLTVRNASVAVVAKGMQDVFMDRPVVDRPGLMNRYDFDLKWAPDDSQSYCPSDLARSRDDPNAPPGIYAAIREQLGLKFIRTNVPIQVMVIDHVETPSEN